MIKAITVGTFDYIIHEGHLELFRKIRQLADHTTVYVVPDSIIIQNKHRLPYFIQQDRADNVLKTTLVDAAILSEPIPWQDYNLYCIGIDQNMSRWTRWSIAEAYVAGCQPLSIVQPHITSTTELLRNDGMLDRLLL